MSRFTPTSGLKAKSSSREFAKPGFGVGMAIALVFVLLSACPASAETPWAIYFDLAEFRDLYDLQFVQGMVRDTGPNVERCEGMIMSPHGNYFLCDDRCVPPTEALDCSLVELMEGVWELPASGPPLLFGWAKAAEWDDHVLLHVGRDGRAVALLPFEPDLRGVHWLSLIGADVRKISRQDDWWRVEFDFRLGDHLQLGSSSAGLCTKYYTDGMLMGPEVAIGLLESLKKRVQYKRGELREVINERVAGDGPSHHLMRMLPADRPIGNVAPYGLVLPSLDPAQSQPVVERLKALNQDGLFPYSTGYIATLADACLVLENLDGISAANLREFRDDSGGMLPQSCTDSRSSFPDFWCQPDYAFTAWAHSLLAREDLAGEETSRYLLRNFERRSSMFIANPFIVDFLTARALDDSGLLVQFSDSLVEETLSSANTDYSFGDFDPVVSTVFALRTLERCGYFGPQFLQGLVFLLRSCPAGECGSSIPFYSGAPEGDAYRLTFYEDKGLLATAWLEQLMTDLPYDEIFEGSELRQVSRRARLTQEEYCLQALSNY